MIAPIHHPSILFFFRIDPSSARKIKKAAESFSFGGSAGMEERPFLL
jgi:hypothetical protein